VFLVLHVFIPACESAPTLFPSVALVDPWMTCHFVRAIFSLAVPKTNPEDLVPTIGIPSLSYAFVEFIFCLNWLNLNCFVLILKKKMSFE
jgi:hypothetical protein